MATRAKSKEGQGAGLLALAIGFATLAAGYLGYLAAGVLDAAISREMEFRADADAARMLCNSRGLVGALVKIGQENKVFSTDSVSARLASANPMFFRSGIKRYWFDSHPPLLARIRALDPARAADLTLGEG